MDLLRGADGLEEVSHSGVERARGLLPGLTSGAVFCFLV